MKATSSCLVTAAIAVIVSGCTSWVLAEDAAAPPAPTAMVRLVAWRHFPATFIKLEGQDEESKLVDDHGTPYGRLDADLLYNRVYQVRFEPSDDPYSFAKFGDRMMKIQTLGSNGKAGQFPAPEPPMILALPVPSTPFYVRNPLGTLAAPIGQVHSMAEFDACGNKHVYYVKPAEKRASGLYADSVLYIKFYHAINLVLEDTKYVWMNPGTPPTAPAVSIIEPKEGETVSGTITVKADITEGVGVQTMAFAVDRVDSGYTGGDPRPYKISIDTTKLADGPHAIVAEAFTASGMSYLSQKVTFKVKNAATGTPTSTPTNK